MNKLTTRAMIVDRYGLRLSMDQVAEILNISAASVYNMLSQGEFPIRTYKEGARRFASYEAVADYLDAKDEEAIVEAKKNRSTRAPV